LGKYYSTAANSNALADSNYFALANSDSRRERSIDIFTSWFSAGVTLGNIRVSDRQPEPDEVAERGGSAAPSGDVNLVRLRRHYGIEQRTARSTAIRLRRGRKTFS
jgi:hypothetical protein